MTGSFVQIHYHNRTGGVTAVMRRYAAAFDGAGRAAATRNLVVAGTETSLCGESAELIDMPRCAYAQHKTMSEFLRARDILMHSLGGLVCDPSMPRPVRVVGHNLTLGKNLALSSAFAAIARRHASDRNLRFYSVVHDFAEEGRAHMVRQISRAEQWGWPMWDDLYASGARVRFVSVSPRNTRILRRAGLPAICLLNPVEESAPARGRLSRRKRARIAGGLGRLARIDGTRFDPDLPSFLYPVRIISRKNILEAILVCCLSGGATCLRAVRPMHPKIASCTGRFSHSAANMTFRWC
ncbi:MAG: hypothetical protein GF418_12185 [Chitinivibrionales bacterium]|nr:hypothetical protein [Chitinivibrionales bacterium]MBD3396377.1 hypothetical protein [Chitinivibrionales bacterium]